VAAALAKNGENAPKKKPLPSTLLRFGFFRFLRVCVLALEAFDATRRIHQFLLTREKWVAVRADFDLQHLTLHRGTGLKGIAAGAVHGNRMIIGVNSFFQEALLAAGLHGKCGALARVARLRKI